MIREVVPQTMTVKFECRAQHQRNNNACITGAGFIIEKKRNIGLNKSTTGIEIRTLHRTCPEKSVG